jgi:predicted nucleic acid-binding protein
MARVYLETSFVSACVTLRVDDASLYQRWQSLSWSHRERRPHDLWISAEVLRELSDEMFTARFRALSFVAGIPCLPIDPDVERLARLLIRERLAPGPTTGDALHAAIAIGHGMDTLLTWDARHLANPNKRSRLERFCHRLGYRAPRFLTPDARPGRDR